MSLIFKDETTSYWLYYLLGALGIFFFFFICFCCSFYQGKKTQQTPTLQQVRPNIQSNRLQNINRFSTNPVRQVSTADSIYSFDTALHNSTMIVQQKNETFEFKLPTYDEYIKNKSNEAIPVQDNDERNTYL